MNQHEIKANYQRCVNHYASELMGLKQKNSSFVAGELLLFGAMVAFLVCSFALDGNTGRWLWGAALSLLAYFVVRHFDDKNKEQIEHLSALLKVCQDEIKAMEGDFSPFEMGTQYMNPRHPYAFDLDIFGPDSLFNRICHTITTGGSDLLAVHLSRQSPLSKEEIEQRRDLQRELSGCCDQQGSATPNNDEAFRWRMEFLALGIQKIETSAVVDAIQKVAVLQVPAWFGSLISLIVGWILIIGICASVLLSVFDVISANVPVFWVMIQYMVVFFACKSTLDKIDSNGGKLRSQLVAYSQILQLIAHRNFQSKMGREMQECLAEALPSFTQLEKILNNYDRRGNFLGLFFTDSFMLSDFFLVRSFLRWKKTYMMKMEVWMDIVSEMDAMVSMADFRYNHPEAHDAKIVSLAVEDKNNDFKKPNPVIFLAKQLYHPFLGENAVKNDFTIEDGNYYIITGANMAGKSTFLRSLGVNYVLAMAGMPVFADSLEVSRFRLFSSMRTSDDLTHGISYFNAELLRLEQLIKFCKGVTDDSTSQVVSQEKDRLRTLIVLDEILKGTNSIDKLNGSRLFLKSIAQLPVSGVIATHDLELSKMETNDKNNRFHNYCFEIDLGLDVTYTYKIQKGVARNQNATFLLDKLIRQNLS